MLTHKDMAVICSLVKHRAYNCGEGCGGKRCQFDNGTDEVSYIVAGTLFGADSRCNSCFMCGENLLEIWVPKDNESNLIFVDWDVDVGQ